MVTRDVQVEHSVLAAYCQGMLSKSLDPELFTGPRVAVAMVFEREGRPSGVEVAALRLADAGVTGVEPSDWYDTSPPEDASEVYWILVDLMVRRRLEACATEFRRLARTGGEGLADRAMEKARWAFAPLAAMGILDKTKAAHEWLEAFLRGSEETGGWVLSWCPILGDILGPLGRETMLVLAGRAGVGKSSVACQMALDLSLQGAKILYCSPDMGTRQTLARMTASLSGIPFTQIWKHRGSAPTLTEFERNRVESTRCEVELRGVRFEDTNSTPEACSLARRLGIDVLIVDYIAQFRVPGIPGEGYLNQEQVTGSVFAFRSLAGICMVILVSHTKIGTAPDIENLAWSGELGRQVDKAVWLEPHKDLSELNLVTAHVLKNRGGPVGSVPFYFFKELMTYVELVKQRRGFVVSGG